MRPNPDNAGFASITEVIVTSIVFVLATAGILATVASLSPHRMDSSQKLDAVYLGKGILDDLRRDVDAETWNLNSNRLAPGNYNLGVISGYTVTYTVTGVADGSRKVDMTVSWPD